MNSIVSENLVPFWKQNVMYRETSLPLLVDGVVKCRLRFRPKRILSVCDSTLEKTFQEGTDFEVRGSELVIFPEKSGIPYLKEEMLRGIGLPEAVQAECTRMGIRNCLFSETDFIIRHQLAITYEYDPSEWTFPVPQNCRQRLKHTMKKLQKERSLRIILFGDSISTGANSSAYMNIPPYLPSWYDMVVQKLSEQFRAEISFENISEAGQTCAWAVDHCAERLGEKEADLMLIAFGMNDASMHLDLGAFLDNVRYLRSAQKNPDCEFLLIGSIVPNEQSGLGGEHRAFAKALYELEDPKTSVVDVGALHEYFLQGKVYADMTGNNVNHPNDFLARLYSISVLSAFGTED